MIGDGKYEGFHVDVCHRIISNLERSLGTKVDVRYQPVTSQNRIPLVLNGSIDLEFGSTTNSLTRQKEVTFAVTTYVEEVRVAVKANSGIDSLTQLAGKVIVTTTGTTSVQLLRKLRLPTRGAAQVRQCGKMHHPAAQNFRLKIQREMSPSIPTERMVYRHIWIAANLDHRRPLNRHGLLNNTSCVRSPFNLETSSTECFCKSGKFRICQIRAAHPLRKVALLVGADRSVGPIVGDHDS